MKKVNIVLLTNILSPYRRQFYDLLYEELKERNIELTVIIMAESEPERYWYYENLQTAYTILLKNKTLKINKRFIHFNWGLKKILQKLNPSLVIASGSYTFPAVWNSIRLKKKFKYKILFWSESHLNEVKQMRGITEILREKMRSGIFKKFDGFWYAGELSKEFINRYANKEKEMYFVPNLINDNVFEKSSIISPAEKESIRENYRIDPNKFIFLCSARLNPVKGIDKFLNLYSKTMLKDKAIILFAGEGEQKEELSKLGFTLDIDIRLIGHQTEKEMINLYSISDCFLLPSLSDPNPLSVIEALWCRLPLFVSEHVGNHPEAVKHEQNGYVFSYQREQETINLIDSMISKSEEWKHNASNVSFEIANSKYKAKTAVLSLIEQMGYLHNIEN